MGDELLEPTDGPDARVALDLADWRRRIFELYAEVRGREDPREGFDRWRSVRDELFRTHPSSPIPPSERETFTGLTYFDHDADARVLGRVEPASLERLEIAGSAGATFAISRIGRVRFSMSGREGALDLFWMEGYAGGLFLPFADRTSGTESYGAGRYLFDSVKGADLGERDGALVLDFNLAYAPSCAYDPAWACPLAPPGNRLPFPVRAGERILS